ncbi:MAG: Na+/H+ antiporter subunit E [Candidatus Hadarchaeales archaeon]
MKPFKRCHMHSGKFVVTATCLFGFWLALTASANIEEVLAGVCVSLIIAFPSHQLLFQGDGWKKLSLSRLSHFLLYIPYYIWAEIKAHADVIYRAIHPKMPIKPGIVKVPIKVKTDFGITAVADSITMTPGTLSVDVSNEAIYVHWINVKTTEPEAAAREISSGFERFVGRIFG